MKSIFLSLIVLCMISLTTVSEAFAHEPSSKAEAISFFSGTPSSVGHQISVSTSHGSVGATSVSYGSVGAQTTTTQVQRSRQWTKSFGNCNGTQTVKARRGFFAFPRLRGWTPQRTETRTQTTSNRQSYGSAGSTAVSNWQSGDCPGCPNCSTSFNYRPRWTVAGGYGNIRNHLSGPPHSMWKPAGRWRCGSSWRR